MPTFSFCFSVLFTCEQNFRVFWRQGTLGLIHFHSSFAISSIRDLSTYGLHLLISNNVGQVPGEEISRGSGGIQRLWDATYKKATVVRGDRVLQLSYL